MTRLLTALVLGLSLGSCSSSSFPSLPSPSTTSTGVALSPSSATVLVGQVLQFRVLGGVGPQFSVIGGQSFTWSVAGTGCSGVGCGAIDATGKYTAPATVPDPATVTVTARSIVDSTKSLATVAISPPESFAMSRQSIEFGHQMVNTISAPTAVTVTNTGSTPQPIRGRIDGSPGQWQDFADTSDCPSMLAVGSSCTFNITFKPSATGNRSAYLLVDGKFEEEGVLNLGGTGTTKRMTPMSQKMAADDQADPVLSR